MRNVLLATLLCASSIAQAQSEAIQNEMIARQGSDSVRLTHQSCPQEVLNHVDQGSRGHFRRAYVSFQAVDYVACWAMRSDGIVFVQYSDGDGGLIPSQMFVPVPDA
jgi:hypothetical protein